MKTKQELYRDLIKKGVSPREALEGAKGTAMKKPMVSSPKKNLIKKTETTKRKAPSGIKKTGKFQGKSNRLGGGGRFAQVKAAVTGKKGVYNPAGLAAYIGRKSLGKKKFQSLAARGKKRTLSPEKRTSFKKKYKHVKMAQEVTKNSGKKNIKAIVKIQKSHIKGKTN